MNCKMENDAEQKFRKEIIYGIVRDYGVGKTALMCGLREDQTDLVYKYSNTNNGLDVPDKRWRMLSQSLTKANDLRIIREYAHPEVLVSLSHSDKLNGRIDDEINNITMYSGKIVEIVRDAERNDHDLVDTKAIIELAEQISSQSATIKREVK